ncbi:hypothetical protein CASFOL_009899 [Castilleja foliolosa]|uniref:Uncharacterized protein n=1 Tax=Castilleja foliolosa TaxID=1961234 RepID=A0ABD3DUN5_9LAMI
MIMRGFSPLFCFGVLLLIISLANINIATKPESDDDVYIVYMGKTSTIDGAPRNDHAQLLTELSESKGEENPFLHIYSKSFLGFSARLTDEEVKSISGRPGVVSVFRDQIYRLQTTRSWDFLINQKRDLKNDRSHYRLSWSVGNDTILGIIDGGIWPEHESFNDKKMDPIPERWNGTCMSGENSTYPFKCNNKLIGARYYDHAAAPGSVSSPRDFDGHGTHVASIAAGRLITGASYYGLANGIARGGDPSSRIAVYCVCGAQGCPGSSILRAFDDAIADGVDVLSISISGQQHLDPLTDPLAIGSFHAVEKGITVLCAAGNHGPSPDTLVNVAPWLITVGATTIDRDFEVDVVLGSGDVIKGGGITLFGLNKSAIYPLVDGRLSKSNQIDRVANNASNRISGSLDVEIEVEGTIVICESANQCITFISGQGALGGIVISDSSRQKPTDFGIYTIADVSVEDGDRILSYINSTSNPLATILPTRVIPDNYKPAPVVAAFSSRGPILSIQNLLKPDIAAPGVGILGAWRLNDTELEIPGKETTEFNIYSGTSQACAHVSGLAVTVKSWHPTWSPSAIRSAIMTTAIHQNNLHAPITTLNNGSRATHFEVGAGEISIYGPLSPGLVYETETTDYVRFLCNMGYSASIIKTISSTVPSNFYCHSNPSKDLISDMNYPSIIVSDLKTKGPRTVERTVTNVGDENSTYNAIVEAPAGVQVQVVPNKLNFTNNVKKQTFQVTFYKLPSTTSNGHLFGFLTWSNWDNKVRIPFVVHEETS